MGGTRLVVGECDGAEISATIGEAYIASLYSNGEDKKRIDALKTSLSMLKYSTNKVTYLSWVKYFDEGEGMRSPYQVDPFLAYWLSYFVFLCSLEVDCTISFF